MAYIHINILMLLHLFNVLFYLFVINIFMLLNLYSNRFYYYFNITFISLFYIYLFIFYVIHCFINIPIGHVSVIILTGVIKRV